MMSKFPFTTTQWQELEHQALIFKYMVSGIPIPPDLLFAIRTSHVDSSPTSLRSKLLVSHHQYPTQHVGWNCFQMGLGRKIDPEPGRCRRTDGKKWRCSKDAFPDSKYCERHMHRGKNRSRKPVEISKSPISSANSSSLYTSSSQTLNKIGDNLHCYSSNGSSHHDQNPSFGYNNQQYHTASKDRNGGSLDLRRNRYDFFSEEPSRASLMEDSCQLPPLTMSLNTHESSYLQHKHQNNDDRHHHYKPLDLDHGHHLDLFGRREDQARKTIHFFDEWPKKEKDTSSPWIDLEDKTSGSISTTTQLSISMPKSYEFPIFTSRNHNGD